ncbi:MAG: endo alpha-1,4 polygalactosaminidase [Alphaproteobacteria bacterium]|nr:endo alpha-1,4 polygalactosaminidase [Alphaproteobacteria bacterium]
MLTDGPDRADPPAQADWDCADGSCTDDTAEPGLASFPVGTRWQWQLSGTVDTDVDADVFDIDLFDVPDATLETLRDQGRTVICYFSAGTHEDWRNDAEAFPSDTIGEPLEEWEGERWLDIRSASVRAVMAARLDHAVERGCDAVEPDNVDAYANDSGFPLDEADQLDFDAWLADAAHERGLAVGLKNATDLVPALVDRFDFAVNEECVAYEECDTVQPFVEAGKAVFHTEYVDAPSEGPDLLDTVCGAADREGFSTLVKTWDLDAWRLECAD